MLDDVNGGGLVIEIDLNLTANRVNIPAQAISHLARSSAQRELDATRVIAVARFDRVGVKAVTTEFHSYLRVSGSRLLLRPVCLFLLLSAPQTEICQD